MKTKKDFWGFAFSQLMCALMVPFGQKIFKLFFEKSIENTTLREVVASIVAIIIAAFLGYKIQHVIVHFAKSSKLGREKLYEIAKHEGKWIEKIQGANDIEYAICTLEYKKDTDSYRYSGQHYRSDGKIVYFQSDLVVYKDDTLHYITSGTTVPEFKGLVPCYGRIEMGTRNNGLCSEGKYNDLLDNEPVKHFSMRKIDKGLLRDFYEKKSQDIQAKNIKDLEGKLDTTEIGKKLIEWFKSEYAKYM